MVQSYKMTNMGTSPSNYSFVFSFEEQFDHQSKREWMIKYWTSGFFLCALYVIIIFGVQHYMRNRPRFVLRRALVIWNIMLASFSIMGVSRTAPEFFYVLRNYGFNYSLCVPSFIEDDCVSGFWTWMFVLSKLPELGDTVFIVLRKQQLIFLHWYHHVTVLLYSWFSYTEYTASARWFIVMNYFVHSIMYTYYALRAMGYKLPRPFAMLITACQLMQMIVGCIVNVTAYQYLVDGQDCQISYTNIKLSIAMYFSYFVLFGWFFYNAYCVKNKPKSA